MGGTAGPYVRQCWYPHSLAGIRRISLRGRELIIIITFTGLGVMPETELLGGIPQMEGPSTLVEPVRSELGESSVAATVTNLLPSAGAALSRSSGDGVPPVPAKLAVRICRGEYIDTGELLPEFWSSPTEDWGKETRSRRTCKIDDIFTWLQSFASYVVVRGAAAPELVLELLAYQSTIIRVSRDFTGLVWVHYDQGYGGTQP